jgi:hypothetical protein
MSMSAPRVQEREDSAPRGAQSKPSLASADFHGQQSAISGRRMRILLILANIVGWIVIILIARAIFF